MLKLSLALIFAVTVLSASTYGQRYCYLPPDVGIGYAAFRRFYYDPIWRRCRPFIYGGGGGNGNNFETYWECMRRCARGFFPIRRAYWRS